MLINLCGPPCSGKSLIASTYIKRHPEFQHISIDDIRRETGDELESWFLMAKRALEAEHAIVESSGLSNKLDAYVLSDLQLQTRGIFTVVLVGETQLLLDRLAHRQATNEKEKVPFQYASLSEAGLIKKFDTLIDGKYPLAHWIVVTTMDRDGVDKEFERAVRQYRQHLERAMNG